MKKSELECRVAQLEKDNGVLFMALTDFANPYPINAPKWFRKGCARLAITRPCAASGGIAVVIESSVGAYYFEDFERQAIDRAAHSPSREALDWRAVCEMARKHINEMNS